MNPTTPIIRIMVAEYEKQVADVDRECERNKQSSMYVHSAYRESLINRLYGMMSMMHVAMSAENCYHSFHYVGTATSTGVVAKNYRDRQIIRLSDPQFIEWRRIYILVD